MRPGAGEHEAVVLDKITELKVVFDAVEDYGFRDANFISEEDKNRFNKFGRHFTGQTRGEEITYGSDKPGIIIYEAWNANPEFHATDSDLAFVAMAAKRVIKEPQYIDRVFNRITGRTRAARRILKSLANAEVN